MKILDRFKEWFRECEEKKAFKEWWIQIHRHEFTGQSDTLDDYHAEMAWVISKMQDEIDALKGKKNE